MGRPIIVSVVLVAAVLAVGFGTFAGLASMRTKPPVVEPKRRPLTVHAVKLTPVTIVAPVEGFGTARADRLAVIGSQVAGQVVELAPGLRDGVATTAGDMLLRIDNRDYKARLRRARSQLAIAQAALVQLDVEERNAQRLIETATAELEVAEREYSRVLGLFESGTSNPRELDAARLALKRARRTLQTLEGQLEVIPQRRAQAQATCELHQAEVGLAELNVERCTIVAPFTGRVERVDAEVGEQVSPGQRLLSLLDPGLIEVPIELPVSLRERARVGAAARLWLESRPEVAWTGRVARISPSADETTRTFSLFVEVVNTDVATGAPALDTPAVCQGSAGRPPLMPGMFVQARIDGPTLKDVLLVPRGAIRRDRVFVCEDGRAYQRDVRIMQRLLDRAVISGLAAGQIVITSNLDVLTDGTPVSPILEESTAVPAMAADHGPASAGSASPASFPQPHSSVKTR